MNSTSFALLIPIVALIATFSFVSVAHWVDGRKKEREAFYRSELLKKLAETTGPQAQQILDLLREEERNEERRRREGLKLGGLVVTMVGIGLAVMMAFLVPKEPVWTIGLIPLLIGVALLYHERRLGPLPPSERGRP